ncbi:phage baseplate assembly protein domain-containing protein, partial [Escherichia coli]
RANSGAEAVVLFPDGDRSHAVVVTVSDRRYRLKGLQTGEVAVYDDQGQSVTLAREGIVVDGAGKTITFRNAPKARFEMDLEVTGQVKDLCDSTGTTMSAMRLAYNGHRHRENGQGSNTDKPDKAMEA